MASPRPSLASSNSIISTSCDEDAEDEGAIVPQGVGPKQPTYNETNIKVEKLVMDKKAQVPGVLHGDLIQKYVTVFVTKSEHDGPVDLADVVPNDVKLSSYSDKTFHSTGYGSASKLSGTKEEVEKLSRRWCYLITALVILSAITLLATAVLSLTTWWTSQDSAPALSPATQTSLAVLSAEEKKFADVDGSPEIVGRTEWVAQPSKWRLNNTLPIRRVVVEDTKTEPCGTPAKCIETIRTIQMVDVEQRHQPDIRYNFMLSDDGKMYWGRGFATQGNITENSDGDLLVAFIGWFADHGPTASMVSAFHKLVTAGVKAGMVAEDYALLARCQLVRGESVGLGLVQALETWPHYKASAPFACEAR